MESAHLYSECLVNLAERVCLISNLPATAGMAGKYISLEQRIKNILSKERKMNTKTTLLIGQYKLVKITGFKYL